MLHYLTKIENERTKNKQKNYNNNNKFSPCSLPKATSEPVNVTPPMKVPRKRKVLMTLAAGSVSK